MDPKVAYLVAYNSLCCLGWSIVWLLAIQSLMTNILKTGSPLEALAHIYEAPFLEAILIASQSAAVLEIVNAALGLVRSSIFVTILQVSSRMVALIACVFAPSAQAQWGAGVMILSWATAEIPRYLFYVVALITGDATKKTPFALFFLRYSLFAALYPTGIMGELSVFWWAAHDSDFLGRFTKHASTVYAVILPIIYVFGSPFMILNMVANRKSAFKKRFAQPPPPSRGLVWPKDAKGERSSTKTNQAILASAVGVVDKMKEKAILSCKAWRFNYVRHLRGLVEVQCQSPEAALLVAQAGLRKSYELFEFVAPDGTTSSFDDAMKSPSSDKFYTHVITGSGKAQVGELQITYKGEIKKGAELKKLIRKWVAYGTIEPSAGEAMEKVIDNPEWCNVRGRYFVLLGAGSAMGPLLALLGMGANVIAIDLDRPNIWQRLFQLARESSGTLTFPMKVDPKLCKTEEELLGHAGCNLFTHTPMIRDWLLGLYPGRPFTVGSYAYLDGALHVQVSLAMDAICRDLSEKRKNTSLAYLCTPTDLHLIPIEAHVAMEENYKIYSRRFFCILMNLLSMGKFLRKNAKNPVPGNGGDFYCVNGISVAQGPNYALAKRMQHWRAIIARSKGCIVSSNVAPSTSTVSVVHNRTFAWAYEGMPYFKPFEIFSPETSNAVMSALLLYDLNEPKSVANPKTVVDNPNQLFSYGSFHGGVWRCAYEVDSIGEASVLRYFGRLAFPWLGAIAPIALAGLAYIYGFTPNW